MARTRRTKGVPVSKPGSQPPARPHPNRIRELRLKGVQLSQEALGVLIGADNSTVSRDESGDQPISRDRMIAYASVFKVTSAEIFIDIDAQMPLPPHMGSNIIGERP